MRPPVRRTVTGGLARCSRSSSARVPESAVIASQRRLVEVEVPEHAAVVRDIAALEVLRTGRVEETGDPLLPYRLIGSDGVEVDAVTEFLHHMLADDNSPASLRSYAYELLAWFRFLAAVDVAWDRTGSQEARDTPKTRTSTDSIVVTFSYRTGPLDA